MTGVSLQPSGAMSLRVSASMMTLVLLALMLRAWARLKSHRKVLIEDVLIIFAAVLFYTDQGLFLYGESSLLTRVHTCDIPSRAELGTN